MSDYSIRHIVREVRKNMTNYMDMTLPADDMTKEQHLDMAAALERSASFLKAIASDFRKRARD